MYYESWKMKIEWDEERSLRKYMDIIIVCIKDKIFFRYICVCVL